MQSVHHSIFSRSLQIMSAKLKRDMYSLGQPGFPIDQVKQLEPDLLSPARYSCVYWVDHLVSCDPAKFADDLRDGGSIDTFLSQKFLYWLEALSLCKSMSEGVHAMKKLEAITQSGFGPTPTSKEKKIGTFSAAAPGNPGRFSKLFKGSFQTLKPSAFVPI